VFCACTVSVAALVKSGDSSRPGARRLQPFTMPWEHAANAKKGSSPVAAPRMRSEGHRGSLRSHAVSRWHTSVTRKGSACVHMLFHLASIVKTQQFSSMHLFSMLCTVSAWHHLVLILCITQALANMRYLDQLDQGCCEQCCACGSLYLQNQYPDVHRSNSKMASRHHSIEDRCNLRAAMNTALHCHM
jgi:hypothetical protein